MKKYKIKENTVIFLTHFFFKFKIDRYDLINLNIPVYEQRIIFKY